MTYYEIYWIPYFGNQNRWTISWTKPEPLTSHEGLGGLPHHLCRCWIWMHRSSQICSCEAVLHAQGDLMGADVSVKSKKWIKMDRNGSKR